MRADRAAGARLLPGRVDSRCTRCVSIGVAAAAVCGAGRARPRAPAVPGKRGAAGRSAGPIRAPPGRRRVVRGDPRRCRVVRGQRTAARRSARRDGGDGSRDGARVPLRARARGRRSAHRGAAHRSHHGVPRLRGAHDEVDGAASIRERRRLAVGEPVRADDARVPVAAVDGVPARVPGRGAWGGCRCDCAGARGRSGAVLPAGAQVVGRERRGPRGSDRCAGTVGVARTVRPGGAHRTVADRGGAAGGDREGGGRRRSRGGGTAAR